MSREQLFIGAAFALLCLIGLAGERWFLEHTRKGRWLVQRCGEAAAVWVLRGLFGGGTLFGVLLACNVIHPVRW